MRVTIATGASLRTATLYHLVQAAAGANVAVTARGGTAPAVTCGGGSCALDLTLEPLSVTTVALR